MGQNFSNDEAVEHRLRRNIFLVFAVRVLAMTTAGLSVPILTLYVARGNVNDAQFFILQAIFHLTAIFFDAPFGYAADRWGRRHFIRWGGAMLVSGATCYGMSSSFLGFLIAELLLAIGQAAIFGAEQALLRDSLERLNRPGEFQKIWGYALSVEMGAAALTTLASGYLFAWKHNAPFYAEAVLFGILVIFSFFLYEPSEKRMHKTTVWAGFQEGVRVCFLRSSWLRWIFVAGAVWAALMTGTMWCQSKLLIGHGVTEANIGIWFASMNLFSGLLGLYLSRHQLELGGPFRVTLLIVLCLAGAMILLAAPRGNHNLLLAGVGLGLTQVVRAVSRIRLAAWIKDALPSEYHATGVSFATMTNRLGFVVLAFCIYPFLNGWSPQEKFIAFSVLAVVSGALLLGFFPKQSAVRQEQ